MALLSALLSAAFMAGTLFGSLGFSQPPATGQTPARAAGRAESASARVGVITINPFPASFVVPPNWKIAAAEGDVVALSPNAAAGDSLIIVHAGLYRRMEQFYAKLDYTFREELKLQAQVTAGPRAEVVGGMNGVYVAFSGVNAQGGPVEARFRAVISGAGVGASVLGFATPAQIGAVGARVEEIARSFQISNFAPDQKAMGALVGRWNYEKNAVSGNQAGSQGGVASNFFATYVFNPDGTFSYASKSSVSVSVEGLGGLSQSHDEAEGRFYVSQGKLILSSDKHGSRVTDYQMAGQYLRVGNQMYRR